VYVELDVVNNARVEGAKELGHDVETNKTYCRAAAAWRSGAGSNLEARGRVTSQLCAG
jgi:hypothetical protein